MKELLSTLFLALAFLARIGESDSSKVSELIKQIRGDTEQKQVQVQTTREALSNHQWQYFTEAVVQVNAYQQFVLDEQDKFLSAATSASTDCLESLPKPLYSILKSGDWNIEMCIGHMAVYGGMLTDDTEAQLSGFNGIASQYPISAVKDLFQSDWASEAGLVAMQDQLLAKMQLWDNVTTMDMHELKKRVVEQFQYMAANDWTLCVNYGRNEVKKLFDQAFGHFEGCARMSA